MLVVATAGVASLLVSAMVAAILMVLLGIMSEQEARDAVNWEVSFDVILFVSDSFSWSQRRCRFGRQSGICSRELLFDHP